MAMSGQYDSAIQCSNMFHEVRDLVQDNLALADHTT